MSHTTATGRVAGKVALITGGARGMGASHARRLAGEGAKVVITDVLDDDGQRLARELGVDARYRHLDVTNPDEWTRIVDATLEEFERLDILVNNAGILVDLPIEEFPTDVWQQVLDIDLSGAFYGMRAVVPAMRQQRSGSIVNISSIGGLIASAGGYAYSAAKFGIRGITKAAAYELGQDGIRVNSVHPGIVTTAMTDGVVSAENMDVPMKRNARPEEISNLVLFLASDEASYSTGSEFVIDGGTTAGLRFA